MISWANGVRFQNCVLFWIFSALGKVPDSRLTSCPSWYLNFPIFTKADWLDSSSWNNRISSSARLLLVLFLFPLHFIQLFTISEKYRNIYWKKLFMTIPLFIFSYIQRFSTSRGSYLYNLYIAAPSRKESFTCLVRSRYRYRYLSGRSG